MAKHNRSPRHESQLDHFVNSFWETEGLLLSQTSSHISPSRHEEHHIDHNSKEVEELRLKEAQRAEHSQKQQDHAQLTKAKKAQHSQKQQDDARLTKAKKAQHCQEQQDNSQLTKAKKAEHSQNSKAKLDARKMCA
ncbi:hypothetical protein N7490_006298 [Penicillium lividum]|nr:hypothetical protein N7490_006298 [Penicillium lividum]